MTLLDLAERYGGHGRDLAGQSAGTVKGARQDTALNRVETNLKVFTGFYAESKPMLTKLKTLIERFANYTSTDDLFDSINQIYRDADRDPELKNWFKSMDRYVRKCLREQGFVLQDQATEEWNQLYDKGQFLFRDRYRDHVDHTVDEIKFLSDQFDQDPQNRAFAQAMEKLFLDLGRDENNKPAFKPHLIKDLTEVIIPGIFENTQYVPIPRIEVSDPMIDLVVENLVIETDNLFPNALEFSSDNYWRYGRKSIKNQKENKIMIAGSGIQMDLRDVAYYLKKKQGFPSITDKGVMDIILAGEGFSFKVAARNAGKSRDRTHFIAIDKVDVVIKNLQIKIKQSNHKLLFSIAKSIVIKVMKPAIQKAIEVQIKKNLENADAYAYSIHREVQRGIEASKNDPENAQNIYQRYVNAVQQKMTEKKKKAENQAKKTDVNVAMTKQDSMFQHISLPGGISTKATEYRDLAAKGDRWESPVFGIGSARESTDVPKPGNVSRKPHQTRQAGIRGGNHPNSGATSGVSSGYGQDTSSSGYGQGTSGYGQGTSGYGQGTSGYGQDTSGYGTGSSSAGYGTAGTQPAGYGAGPTSSAGSGGSTQGMGLAGTQPTGTTGTGAARGLNAEMDQAFSATSGQPHAGSTATGGQPTFYDSATRQ